MSRSVRVLFLFALPVGAIGSCSVYRAPEVVEVPKPSSQDSVFISSPVRAHLLNGETILYESGIAAVRDTLYSDGTGAARRYTLSLRDGGGVGPLPLDSVVGLESVRDRKDVATSTLLTLLSITAVAVPIIACASDPKCFGSCPTIYSDSAGTPVLEAEGFSYSIAPIFEAPDLDRLRARPDPTGAFHLEIRDEAYETHYINRLGLIEVRHDSDELALPDAANRPVAVASLTAPLAASDRDGRNVLADLAAADGRTYRTAPAVLARADSADSRDFVDLMFAQPALRDTVALVFRMRNSLLNTVLLYDLMLGDPGLRSLDWVGRDLTQIGPATHLARWYVDHMGMRISVWEGGAYREVARVADTGPVAWKDVAVRIPVPSGNRLRVRLTFVADNWRIDQVRLAERVRGPEWRPIAPAEVLTAAGRPDTAALTSLRDADQAYLVTSPAQRFFLRFDVGPEPKNTVRTFLLASQGYYIEWLRGSWLSTARQAATFEPSDEALVTALQRWRSEQRDLERQFAATRVPVR